MSKTIGIAMTNYLATFTPYPEVGNASYEERRFSWRAERERAAASLQEIVGGIGTVVEVTLRGGRRMRGVLAADMQVWCGQITCQHKRSSDGLGGDWTLVKPAKVIDVCDAISIEVVTDEDALTEWARGSAIVRAAGGRHGGHRDRLLAQ